jgi:CheY-like chemotaxis protein
MPDPVALKILIVEDEPLIAMTLLDMVEELGHQPLEAFNAAKAEQLFAAHEDIDLVITDIGLPDLPGDALVDRLRALRPLLPVIFASGQLPLTLPPARTVWLGKPFRLEDLMTALRQVMAQLEA